jgi:hypothetical protein
MPEGKKSSIICRPKSNPSTCHRIKRRAFLLSQEGIGDLQNTEPVVGNIRVNVLVRGTEQVPAVVEGPIVVVRGTDLGAVLVGTAPCCHNAIGVRDSHPSAQNIADIELVVVAERVQCKNPVTSAPAIYLLSCLEDSSAGLNIQLIDFVREEV